MGDGKKAVRKRAVGTREHIMAYLTEVGELSDHNGMASTQLAAAVGYPGSSVAFAQLLSGMERSGLIEREVRGKRTYRIGVGPARATAATGGPAPVEGPSLAGFDYDELARRLLVQVVRHISESQDRGALTEERELALSESKGHGVVWTQSFPPSPPEERGTSDEGRRRQGKRPGEVGRAPEASELARENVRLREQLRDAQRSLAQAAERVRRLPVPSGPASNEVVLLQRLLSPWVRA
jgi:hypothetical protein